MHVYMPCALTAVSHMLLEGSEVFILFLMVCPSVDFCTGDVQLVSEGRRVFQKLI